jgi:Holliday junction resolvase
MMMAKPIVAIMDPCQLSDEIVQINAGIHIRNEDVQGLVNFIIQAQNNPIIAQKMSCNARRLYECKYSKL